MLTIVIGIAISAFTAIAIRVIAEKIGSLLKNFSINAVGIAALIFVFGSVSSIFLGLFLPTQYEERALITKRELVPFESAGKETYLSISDGEYFYHYKVETDEETKNQFVSVDQDIVSQDDGKITVVKDKNSTPVMYEYMERTKPTIWSFGILQDKVEYEFYVPYYSTQ